MNNEDIKLLLKDLSARLTFGVKIQKVNEPESAYRLYSINTNTGELKFTTFEGDSLSMGDGGYLARVGKLRFKPYLRSMSSMTDEEKLMYEGLMIGTDNVSYILDVIDWLNKNHFDYRGLIEKGLAVKVTKENNPYK